MPRGQYLPDHLRMNTGHFPRFTSHGAREQKWPVAQRFGLFGGSTERLAIGSNNHIVHILEQGISRLRCLRQVAAGALLEVMEHRGRYLAGKRILGNRSQRIAIRGWIWSGWPGSDHIER